MGYIPNEQVQFVDCIRKVIQQQRAAAEAARGAGAGGQTNMAQPQQQQGQPPQGMVSQSQVQISSQFGMQGGGTVSMASNPGKF